MFPAEETDKDQVRTPLSNWPLIGHLATLHLDGAGTRCQ